MTTTITTATPAIAASSSRIPAGAQVGIPPRRMDFDFSAQQAPRYCYDNDPFLSSFWNTFSSLLPEGESFFVEAVRHYRTRISDPVLKAQVAGFIGQEAMHSKEHDAFNKMIRDMGLPIDKLDRDVGLLLKFAQKYTPKGFQLAATVCLEHYTAIIAEQLLRDNQHQNKITDPGALKMWVWHALEENEHKTVAYDVYEKTVDSYLLRVGTMVPTTIILFAVLAIFQARMLAADGQLFKLRQNLRGLNYLWGRKGLFPKLLPQFLDFFRPGFHPSQHDTTALLAEWNAKLFGAGGLLVDQIKNPQILPRH